MEKERLVDFIANIMEDSGFKIKKNYSVSNQIIDIYGILETSIGEVGVIVACKNYEEPWKIGLDVLKDMEIASRAVGASKIIIFTTSSFTHGAVVYAQKRNIKLVDRKGLIKIAKNYAEKRTIVTETDEEDDYYYEEVEYYEPINTKPASLNPVDSSNSHAIFSGRLRRNNSSSSSQYYRNNISTQPSRYLNRGKNTVRNKFSLNINIDNTLDFFTRHEITYMILLIIVSSLIAYFLNILSAGPYTGMGRILICAIICFGGMLLINRNLSEVLFRGGVLFFISLIISIITLTV